MVVVTCVIKLQLDGVYSLKEKRRLLKPLLKRLPQQFNLAAAEIEHQDVWQTAVIGLAGIGNEPAHLHRMMEKAVAWIEQNRPDIPIAEYHIEFR